MRGAMLLAGLGVLGAACDGLDDPATLDQALASDIVINEHSAGSSGWVELTNTGAAEVDVSGWTIDDILGGGTAPKVLVAGSVVPAGGFLVVTYSGLNTASTDTIHVLDGTGATVDSHANGYAGSSISGLCFGRRPDGGDWAAAAIPCSSGASNGGGTPPPTPRIRVNEFYPGASGWVELTNVGTVAADLTGWTVDDIAGGGTSPRTVPAGTTLAPGAVVLVGYSGINTASADEVRVLDPAGAVVDSHANFFAVDPCYGAGRCYGRLPDGGDWAPAHIPCSGGAANPATAPVLCVPGAGCDDGDACTTGDTCSAACACTPGAPLSCDDGSSCTADVCLPASGCTNPVAPDGLACEGGATCLGGVCGGTDPTPCIATGGTYKTVVFTRAEECQAVGFLNRARYSQMNPIPTTARDIAYDCSPASVCGYRSAIWATVAEYADAHGAASSLTVGTTSLLALRATSATWVDDGLWYDTVAHTYVNRAALNGVWVHLEKVVAEYGGGLCLLVRDAAGATNYLSACFDPWHCGPEGCPANYAQQYDGSSLSVRGRLTNETGSWRIAIKFVRNANPAIP